MIEKKTNKCNSIKKIGFIYDGETELKILKSKSFLDLLDSFCLKSVGQIEYDGKIGTATKNLMERGAQKVIILTDKEKYPSEAAAMERYKEEFDPKIHKIILVCMMFESWFLADTLAMEAMKLKSRCQFTTPIDSPEKKGFSFLKNLFGDKYKKLRKPDFAVKMIDCGFTVENAANHTQCPSAKNFINYLKSLNP